MNIIVHMGAGGAQELLINYLRMLKNDEEIDYWVYVIEGPRNSKYDNIIKTESLQVRYMYSPRTDAGIGYIKFIWKKLVASKNIYQAIKSYQPDIIHTHITKIFECALLPITFTNKKTVKLHTLHSNPYSFSKIDCILAQIAFKMVNVIPVCINEEQRNLARKRYKIKETELLYNGIDFEEINRKRIPKPLARRQLNIADESFVIGAVGRIKPVKNYRFLIDVFYEITKINSSALLIIAGDGDRQELEERVTKLNIQNKVKFLGEVSDIVPIYCALDIYLLTSIYESCSLTTLEAQALGIKCVVSDVIPEESIYSNLVMRLSLNLGAMGWSEQIISFAGISTSVFFTNEKLKYSLRTKVDELKKIYKRYFRSSN